MSTRGLFGFVIDGADKLIYNHSDSYPDYLGGKVLEYIRTAADEGRIDELRNAVGTLAPVKEDENPTPEQLALIGKRYWSNVDTGENWYAYLRETQGDIDAIIHSGFIILAEDVHEENPFIEWTYVIDFDANEFITYSGSPREDNFLLRYPFDNLPTVDEYLTAVNGGVE
jgi:hypothetical protein